MNLNVNSQEGVRQVFEQQAQFFKLLTHPARLAILEVLRKDESCVCHLEAVLGFRQAYLSQQLAVLREAGLIQDRRDGWNVFYRVSDPSIFAVVDAAEKLIRPEGLPNLPEHPADCPCPKCNPAESGQR